jgi:hypothetical protein
LRSHSIAPPLHAEAANRIVEMKTENLLGRFFERV